MSRLFATSIALALATFAGQAAAGVACSPITLPSSAQFIDGSDAGAFWIYSLLGDGSTDLGFGGADPDILQAEFYFTNATGTFDLGTGDDANYATCAHCLLLYQDIQPDNSVLKFFFQSAGSMVLNTAPGESVPTVNMNLSGVQLIEVTIDPNTFVSTPVPGGACYVQSVDEIFADGFDGPSGRSAPRMQLRMGRGFTRY
jgi:hypothetical protein